MNQKFFKSCFSSILLLAFFLLGLQQSAQAQANIINDTDCDIFVKLVYSSDINSCTECTSGSYTIPANSSKQTSLAIHCYNPSSAQHWVSIEFQLSPNLSGTSISYNPTTGCGTDALNTFCNSFTVVQANWVVLGSGAVTITLN